MPMRVSGAREPEEFVAEDPARPVEGAPHESRVGYEQIADLLPYLDGPTREIVVNSGTNGLAMPSYPWSHPTGWFRHDLYERGSGGADFAYLTLDTLRERHLDVYDISLGVVEP